MPQTLNTWISMPLIYSTLHNCFQKARMSSGVAGCHREKFPFIFRVVGLKVANCCLLPPPTTVPPLWRLPTRSKLRPGPYIYSQAPWFGSEPSRASLPGGTPKVKSDLRLGPFVGRCSKHQPVFWKKSEGWVSCEAGIYVTFARVCFLSRYPVLVCSFVYHWYSSSCDPKMATITSTSTYTAPSTDNPPFFLLCTTCTFKQ